MCSNEVDVPYIFKNPLSVSLLEIDGTDTRRKYKLTAGTVKNIHPCIFFTCEFSLTSKLVAVSAYDAVDASYIFKRLSDTVDKAMYNAINRVIISRQFVLHTQQCYRNDIIVEQD